ncbi:unnamed protein product [Malus baccata var. baccata]
MASLKLITFVRVFIFLHLIQYIAMSKVVLAADETGRLVVLRSSLVDVEKVKIAGFIPFNADYHFPKPHPPKNN